MFKKFSVCFSSLSLLKNQEQGIISRFNQQNQSLIAKMMALGIVPGIKITLIKRHPYFVVELENTCVTLDPDMVKAIYVRVFV